MYIARSSAGATDAHQEALSRMCRIGGAKFLAMSRAMCYPVKDFAEEIAACSGVDVTADETGVHPSSFCVICRSVINRYSKGSMPFLFPLRWRWWGRSDVAASSVDDGLRLLQVL